ncbi:MAG: 5-oxoprolinase subunit PxpA [Deltaproteobacteria bacterium]|nr:5-oxoprolinase subunit PxpA [Deltaproteobacteria bacterium]
MIAVDVNADLGEGEATDARMFTLVSSANIACGGHAGDEASMQLCLRLAKQHGVAAGAHPGFVDRQNKGRRTMTATPLEVHRLVSDQVRALATLASREGVRLGHVKAHGALYNQAAQDPALARALAEAVVAIDPAMRLFGLPGSCMQTQAKAVGLQFVGEAFVDRAYDDQGHLVPRQEPGAVLTDPPHRLAARAVRLATGLPVPSLNGAPVVVAASTLCVHGDTPAAVAVAAAVREALRAHAIAVRAPNSAKPCQP